MSEYSVFKVGDKVDVGGAVGSISLVTNDYLVINGVYRYFSDEDEESNFMDEEWAVSYIIDDLTEVKKDRLGNWNFRGIPEYY